jgi:small nuclear ribonucleoprotein (snRNP)-like protein
MSIGRDEPSLRQELGAQRLRRVERSFPGNERLYRSSNQEHFMTTEEVHPFVGKSVRVTMADGRILAGSLHADDGHGHGHMHYAVVSAPVEKGQPPVTEVLHGAEQIVQIEDASSDPAASE